MKRLNAIASHMKRGLQALEHVTIHDSGNELVPIIPIMTGNDIQTMVTAKMLLDRGVYVNPVFPPGRASGFLPAAHQLYGDAHR